MDEHDIDGFARRFIDAQPPYDTLRIASRQGRYMISYGATSMRISEAYGRELLASGRAVEVV